MIVFMLSGRITLYNQPMRRILSALLVVITVFMLVSCATAQVDLQKGYSVVISSATDKDTVSLAKRLASTLSRYSGSEITVIMDGNPESGNEISLGITNRGYSLPYTSTLRSDDWCYVVSGGRVVVAGGNAESLAEAVQEFSDYVYDNDGAVPSVEYFHRSEYEVDSFLLGGSPIYEYTIVVPSMSGEVYRAACFLRNLISYRTGYLLTVGTSAKGKAIFVGKNVDDSAAVYSVKSDGKNLEISGPQYMLMGAVRDFFGRALEEGGKSIEIQLPVSPVEDTGNYENGFVLASSESSEIREGITYTVNRYVDADGAPVVAYILKVEKGAATLINGTPGGGYELHNVRATTLDAAISARDSGYDVIGAVNADFFRINEDGSPRGTCIKNSVIMQITDDTSRSFFAVLDDGSYYCAAGAPEASVLEHIVEAVGGAQVLIKDGEIVRSNNKERHPRTVVGYDGEGAAYLVVVDGRQTKISNGGYLGDMSLLLREIGATDGINLDGGGSSTFLLNENGSFNVKNSPSDGVLRQDYNSLIVVSRWI